MNLAVEQPAKWLFGNDAPSVALFEIDPCKIHLRQVHTQMMVEMQKTMSKAIWRPAPGRKLAFYVVHENTTIGLVFLASPVINLGPRDQHLNLPADPKKRGQALRSIMDLSVCVAAQPLGWHWNLGKLCAMLACTVGDAFQQRYGEDLRWITTTSLWGRGSQYNRIYKFLGYTKGFGHEHIDDGRYEQMMQWMRDNNVPIPSCKFGSGSNPRMRRIAAYRKAAKDRAVTLRHGHQRGIYIHEAIDPSRRREIVMEWYQRWGVPRFRKTRLSAAPYENGIQDKPTSMSEATV